MNALERQIPRLIWILVILTLILIPLKIVEYGYLPQADALRHAAKALSGKDWGEILVLRGDMTIDQHAGWHAVLELVHRISGAAADGLVVFSIVVLCWLASLSALGWTSRPETWIASLLLFSLGSPDVIHRLTMGRPLLLTVGVLITLLFVWTRGASPRDLPIAGRWTLTVVLVALAAWIHGSWYLFRLPVAGFLLARQWRRGFELAACCAAGILLGAMLTGHPLQYFVEQLRHLFLSLGAQDAQRFLVSEFQPSDGAFHALVAVALVLIVRTMLDGWQRRFVDDPTFWLGAIGWVLSFKVYRFWSDWALPALMVWTAVQLHQICLPRIGPRTTTRLMATAFLCAALLLSTTADVEGRWSQRIESDYLDGNDPSLADWLPAPGGTLFNVTMGDFYRSFFANPHGHWRYMLGFEPALMPAEDLETYRELQRRHYDVRSLERWVRKMTDADRLLVRKSGGSPPALPELDWHRATGSLWLGRIPPS